MQAKKRFSLNWGKGAVIISMITVAIALFFFVAGLPCEVRGNTPVAVEWGDMYSTSPIKEPPQPPQKLAVEWGDSYSTSPAKEPPQPPQKVAVEWGDMYSASPTKEPPQPPQF